MSRTVAALAVLGLLALAVPARSDTAEPYQINVILPMTGPGAFLGKNQSEALAVYERTSNASAGPAGRTIHFNVLDDQSNPQVALQLVNGLLPQHPAVIVGFSTAAECGAVIPVVNAAGPVTYCFSPVVQPPRGSYVFGASVSTEYIIPTMIKFARERGYLKLAMINANDATGVASERSVAAALALPANGPVRLVAAEHFAPSDVSIAAQVADLKAAGPDIVFTFAQGPAFGNILRTLHDGGVNVPVLASAANMNYEQLAQYTDYLPKELLFNGFRYQEAASVHGPLRVASDKFLKAFKGAGIRPTPVQSLAWDPAALVTSALANLGWSATATQLRDYIETLHGYVGLNGVYDFRNGNQHGLTDTAVIVVRWDPRTAEFVPITGPGAAMLPAKR